MTKYYFLIVFALVSLALISVPKTAVAQPAPTPIQEPAPKVFEDAVLGEKWRVIINKKAVLAYKNNNPGNLRYAWALDRRVKLPAGRAYPKLGGRSVEPLTLF